MTYEEQLSSREWKEKRQIILKRDCNKCQSCSNRLLFEEEYLHTSYIAIGSLGSQKKRFVILVYNNQTNTIYRCKTDFKESEIEDLKKVNHEKGFLALYTGHDIFSNLFGFLILPNKIDLSSISELRDPTRKKESDIDYQKAVNRLQLAYIKNLDANMFQNIEWVKIRGLHIHHKYYVNGYLAWEYPNEALITLCWNCHEKLHQNTKIPILNKHGLRIGEGVPCKRCSGAGYLPIYRHVQNGICFECRGEKYTEYIYFDKDVQIDPI